MTKEQTTGASAYRKRIDRLVPEIDKLEKLSSQLSLFRLILFIMAVASFLLYEWVDSLQIAAVRILGIAAAVCFVGLVLWHRRVARVLENKRLRHRLCQDGMARIERQWESLSELADPELDDPLGIAKDLDLTGPASLYRLTGGSATEMGKQTLMKWLLHTDRAETIHKRQNTVEELAYDTDRLLDVATLGIESKNKTSKPSSFLDWAEGSAYLQSRPVILWLARLLAPLPLVLGILHGLEIMQRPLWLLALLVNFAFSGLLAFRLHSIFNRVSSTKQGLDRYFGLLRLLSTLPLESPLGKELKARLQVDGRNAAKQMKRLEKITNYTDLRFSPMLHFPIQIATLWDFFWLYRLEKWQLAVGKYCRGWLDTLGEFEALSCLAVLAHDNPSWVFPTLVSEKGPTGQTIFEATDIGHPLVSPKEMVTNDVSVGPPGRFLLVTGSNMSGKSTLLRAIGLNAVLANAGGPVSARSLSMPPVVLGTSFRITDSVEKGISFFMAELMRIKAVVDLAQEVNEKKTYPLLFLFDEILQGTNIIDRQTAVRAILLHLLKLNTIGAISSHDLTLAEAEGIAEAACPVYFTEQYNEDDAGPNISFDYKLRKGIAPTTNAIALVKLVGLDLADLS